MSDLPDLIAETIAAYPPEARTVFKTVRAIIFEEADRRGVGPLEETLKWGEPAYLTSASKSGSTIRMAWTPKTPGSCNLYFNCKTDIVDRFQADFPGVFETSTNRCIHLPLECHIADVPLRAALGLALTYHRDRKMRG